tara:strand:- start:32671 stop:33018 length:348 start_codon:yes stop_codon:yes gene_type:complete
VAQYDIYCGVEAAAPALGTLRPFLPIFPALRNSPLAQTVLALTRKNTLEKSVSMVSQGRSGGFLNNRFNFSMMLKAQARGGHAFGDRLTTWMSSAEPVQGCTLFGVSPKACPTHA